MPTSERRNVLPGLAGWLAVTAAAAAIGAMSSVRAPQFYSQLTRPDWAPPSSLFGPVWTALYTLMAIAAFLVWRDRGWRGARGPLTLYLVQLALNAAWTWLFFGLRSGPVAFAEIVLLLAAIVATMIGFWRVRPVAGALLLPYLAWTSFATALTWALWRANPGIL
ncbi:MAG: tryptophan-rich sensory protein [Gemmatimonadaceae bacterium]|nr:tryptophan-rich sensory protein [Gemmatimonadaceae bacterium]